ncbi:MAG: hypothetical protein ACRC1K_20745, partial [Planctomycetia bacterium]
MHSGTRRTAARASTRWFFPRAGKVWSVGTTLALTAILAGGVTPAAELPNEADALPTLPAGVAAVATDVPEAVDRVKQENLDRRLRTLREKSRSVSFKPDADLRNVQAQDNAPGGPGVKEDDDDEYFKVEIEPPTRARLFLIGSDAEVLRQMERDFRDRGATQVFLYPNPEDDFNRPDATTMGLNWYQNRRTGTKVDENDANRRGEIYIENDTAVYPPNSPREVAILYEAVGTPDVAVRMALKLPNNESQFGLVVRALDPTPQSNEQDDVIDQLDTNKFYYVVFSGDRVTVGKRIAGRDVPLKSATLAPKLESIVEATTLGNEIRVLRDGEEVLKVLDDELKGTFV